MEREFIPQFVMAGNATFTLYSGKLQRHYTYKVKRDPKLETRFFVKTLIGPDNEQDYRYIGLFYEDTMSLRTSSAAHIPHTAPQFVMMQHFLRILNQQVPWPDTCHFYPSKKCGRCGHTLTTPESIARGLGPECAEK